MIHLSDTAAAYVGLIGGLVMALVGALIPSTTWDRMYGTPRQPGLLSSPILRRIPRWAGRGLIITVGVLMVGTGVLLFALGRA